MELRPEIALARKEGPKRFEVPPYDAKSRGRKIIAESGEIDRRRFLLSADPETREKLLRFKDIAKTVHQRYPEMIGVTIFGSQVKGYANNRSDLDAYFIIDKDIRSEIIPPEATELKTERRTYDLETEIIDLLKAVHLGLGLGSGIGIRSISDEKITEFCQKGILDENTRVIMHLFHLGIGTGIYERREQILSNLENLGENGERIWGHLMENLFRWENEGFDETLQEKRRTLYPRTLSEGRAYFLTLHQTRI